MRETHMDVPLVSVVILSHNRLRELKETLNRTNDLQWPNLETIIVDDNSTDGSKEFIKSLEETKYKKILIPSNKGSAYGHTQGMKMARGEFVITIDDDCFLRPTVVAKSIEILRKNPNLAGFGYGFVNPLTDFDEKKYWDTVDFPVRENQYHESYDGIVYTSAAIFRKLALEKIRYHDLNWFYCTEDLELNYNLIAHGYNLATIPELIAYHKSAPSNRNFDQIVFNGVYGVIWLILKYYPWRYIFSNLMSFLYLCTYYSIINNKFIYLKAAFWSLEKAPEMLKNKIRLRSSIYKHIFLPRELIFSR